MLSKLIRLLAVFSFFAMSGYRLKSYHSRTLKLSLVNSTDTEPWPLLSAVEETKV